MFWQYTDKNQKFYSGIREVESAVEKNTVSTPDEEVRMQNEQTEIELKNQEQNVNNNE